ncbi:MAG: DUF3237 domain-containing protein [Tepidiformaceae bacterium]
MVESALAVEHLFTLVANIGERHILQGGPQGARAVVNVVGGSFEGAELKGKVLPPGGDWATLRADGSVKLDVRAILHTEDGARILITYLGIGTNTPEGLELRTAPMFETGDERYAWLNNVQAVGKGKVSGGTVTYEVYRLI